MSTTETPQQPVPSGAGQSPTLAYWVYGLYLASVLTGITAIIGVVIAHVKRGDAAGSWLESHYQWQIRTFWFSLLGAIISGILMPLFGIGALLGLAVFAWYIYRAIKGLIRLSDAKPIENPAGWL